MAITLRLVDLTTMHPRLLWDDITAATVAMLSETRAQPPFLFALTLQELPGFGSAQLQLAIDPIGVAAEHVHRLRRTYAPSRLVELAAIAIAGLGLYHGGGHEMRDVAWKRSGLFGGRVEPPAGGSWSSAAE